MTKKLSLSLAALVAAIVGIGALLVPAQAAEKLGTARGWCVKSSTGELRTLRLTTAGKCQPGYWGPISLASGVKGPQGPAGPKGDKGDPGEGGTVVLCTAGYTSRDIVVANAAKTNADAAKLKAAQTALASAKNALVDREADALIAANNVVTAQSAVDAADSVAARLVALKALADKVLAKKSADNSVVLAGKAVVTAQAELDRIIAAISAPETFTVKACVKG
ncbi:MAG: collagen-like protein [Kineosporiaceae bacterium]|nr:collagen-like protein [Kineosporiaceae bacterium]